MTILAPDVQLGAQRPRVSSFPKFSTSAGAEAVDLAATFGLVLDPWQAFVLEQSLGERADGRWAAFEVGLLCPRQNGKGAILEARELAGLFLFGEREITHSAHELKTSKDHFKRIESLLRGAGYGDDLVRYRRSNEEVSITVRKTGYRILFLTRTNSGGRGLGGDLVVLDEAYALTADMMAALMPTMAARSMHGNPQQWFSSSAGFSFSRVLAKVCADGAAGKPRLAFFDWSAASDVDSADREAWAGANPGLGRRISEEFVASEFDRLEFEEFRRERLGIWAREEVGSVISGEMWARICDPASRRDGDAVSFGVAVEEDRSSAAVAVSCASTVSGRVHSELVRREDGTAWVVPFLLELAQRRRPAAVVVDSAGPAGSLLGKRETARLRPIPAPPSVSRRAAGGFFDAVRDGSAVHTGLQKTLTDSVTAGQPKWTGDTWEWRRDLGSAPLIAQTLAHYGWTLKRPTGPRAKAKVVVMR